MVRPILLTLFLLLPVSLRAEEPLPPEENDIVPKGAKLELLYTRSDNVKGGLTEGPAAAPDGSIYFSDIRLGKDKSKIMRFDPKTKKTTVFSADSGHANGLMFDAKGNLIACEGSDLGGRCVSRWDVKTGKRTVIVDKYMGKHFNAPNDLCIDLKGRIYFTDPRYLGDEPRELEHRAVYRIDTDGSVEEITHEVEKPNGIDISPDQKTLYVVDHNNGTDKIDPKGPTPKKGAMELYAFPLGDDGKVNGKRKTLIDFGEEDGIDRSRLVYRVTATSASARRARCCTSPSTRVSTASRCRSTATTSPGRNLQLSRGLIPRGRSIGVPLREQSPERSIDGPHKLQFHAVQHPRAGDDRG